MGEPHYVIVLLRAVRILSSGDMDTDSGAVRPPEDTKYESVLAGVL